MLHQLKDYIHPTQKALVIMYHVRNRGITPSSQPPTLRQYGSLPTWESFKGFIHLPSHLISPHSCPSIQLRMQMETQQPSEEGTGSVSVHWWSQLLTWSFLSV